MSYSPRRPFRRGRAGTTFHVQSPRTRMARGLYANALAIAAFVLVLYLIVAVLLPWAGQGLIDVVQRSAPSP